MLDFKLIFTSVSKIVFFIILTLGTCITNVSRKMKEMLLNFILEIVNKVKILYKNQ